MFWREDVRKGGRIEYDSVEVRYSIGVAALNRFLMAICAPLHGTLASL